jgi:hypothetical protein
MHVEIYKKRELIERKREKEIVSDDVLGYICYFSIVEQWLTAAAGEDSGERDRSWRPEDAEQLCRYRK